MQDRIKDLAVEAEIKRYDHEKYLGDSTMAPYPDGDYMRFDDAVKLAQAVARECAEICDGMPYRAAGAGKASQSIRARFGLGG